MKNDKRKRAFTLVELVIVIAVIAILVAVLMPTFANVLDKSRQSTDIQTARNIEPEMRNYALNYGNYLSASDMRYVVGHEDLFPTNKENDSYWYEISTGRVKLCKGSELSSTAGADSESHILEEIIPGYILLDNGGTKLGERIRELRNLEDAGSFESILIKLSDSTVDYGLTPSQVSGMIEHLRLFSPTRTLYINNFGYITNIPLREVGTNEYFIAENVVFCDGIMEFPEFTLTYATIDENTIACFPNGIMIPKSMQVINQGSVLRYTGRYTDLTGSTMETDFSLINTMVKTQGDPNNMANNLFSEYMLEKYPAIRSLEINARSTPMGQCTFTISINSAIKRPIDDIYDEEGNKVIELTNEQVGLVDNMYSELSIIIHVPEMYDYKYDEEKNVIYDEETGEPVIDYDKLLNEGILSEKFKYTKQADGSIRVDARIYDQYGALCTGTTVYKPDVMIDGFRFNKATIFYSTPEVKIADNEKVRYKLYIKNASGNYVLVDTMDNTYTDTAAAQYSLDQTSDLDGYMLFLATNDGYKVYDNDGYYAEYDGTKWTWFDPQGNYTVFNGSTYQWKNADTGSNISGKVVQTPTKANISNYYVYKEILWQEDSEPSVTANGEVTVTTYYQQTSKINKEKEKDINGNVLENDVLNEYFYACTTVVTQTVTEEGKYIQNNVIENHEGFARYVYPYIVDSSYITSKTSENGQTYNAIDSKIELYFVDKDGNEQILAKRSETFGTPENPIKPYYYTETVYKQDTIRYKYNYKFKNPLYYENGSSNTELFTFVDKDIIYYQDNGNNSYNFKVNYSPVESKVSRGLDIWYVAENGKDSSLVGNYDAEYNVKYTFNLDRTKVNIEITGIDTIYSIMGAEKWNTVTYNSRYTYRYTLSRSKLESETEFILDKFNGRSVALKENSTNQYVTYIYKNEEMNPLTTIFTVIDDEGIGQECNANVFDYTKSVSDNPSYDVMYTFSASAGDIKLYCTQRNMETSFNFIYPDIENSEMTVIQNGSSYTYNNSTITSSTIDCGYGEVITLRAKDFGEDSDYTFVAWYETTPEYGKRFISDQMETEYTVVTNNIVISCEYATNCLKNDVLLFSNGKITYCNDKTITTLFVPSYVEGNEITGIETNAFVGVTNLEVIYLPDTIATIDTNAFIGSKINIAGSTTYFGTYLYKYVDERDNELNPITEYTVKEGTKIIGDYAFSGNSNLRIVRLPDSVSAINARAFQKMTELEYVYVTENSTLTTIGEYAFSRCDNFKGIIVEGSDDVIPAKLTTLGNCAFEFCKSLEKFDFTNIKTLGVNCFQYCINITSVDFTETQLTTLPHYTFNYCTKLSDVILGDKITTLNNYVFSYCSSLVELYIPNTVTKIGVYLCAGCDALEKIVLPSFVNQIYDGTFQNCSNLNEIYIGGDEEENLIDFTKIIKVGANGFQNCYAYPFGDLVLGESGVTFTVGSNAFSGCNNMTSFTFKGVWSSGSLPANLFYNSVNLRTADLGGATNLGTYCFGGCTALVTAKGFTLTTINSCIFYNCTNLKTISVKDFSGFSSVGAQAFYACNNLELGDVVLGSYKSNNAYTFDTIIVNDRAFYQCHKMTSFTAIAKSVDFRFTNNASYASYTLFYNCKGLKSFTVNADNVWFVSAVATAPNSLTSFKFLTDCTALTELNLNCKTTEIRNFANNKYTSATTQDLARYICENCTALKTAVIPYNTKYLINAFIKCTNLETVTRFYSSACTGSVTTTLTSSFTNVTKFAGAKISENGFLYKDVTTGSKEKILGYLGTNRNAEIPTSITSGYTVDEILAGSFRNSKIINNLVIPASVITIGNYAFENSVFAKITFNHTVAPAIADNAFKNINNNVVIVFENIEGDDWQNIDAFKDLYVTGGGDTPVNEIFVYSSDGTMLISCTQNDIINVVLPDTVTKISSNVFKNNTSLVSVDMPGVTEVMSGAFEGCTSLTTVNMPACTIIRDNAFKNCPVSLQLPESLTYIGESAFEGTLMVSVTIPSTVTHIGKKALYNTTLKEVTVVWTIPTVTPGKNAFNSAVTGFKIIVPSVSAKAEYSTRWSTYSTYLYAPTEAEYTISDGILTAFNKSKVVTELDLTSETSLTRITNVLAGYTTLVTLRLPSTVTTIDDGAFLNCTGLKNIIFSGETEITNIGANTFSGCSSLKDISGLKWGSVATIGDSAFKGTQINITGFEIYAELGTGVFQNCKKMTNITIRNKTGYNRTTIPANTFNGCSVLNTVVLPNGITTIGANAFLSCAKLTTITNLSITDLASIGSQAFKGCTSYNFGEITVNNSAIVGATNAFNGCVKITKVTINNDNNTSTTLPTSIFSGCTALTTVVLNDKITTIDTGAFNGCSKLISVGTPDMITEENQSEKLIILGYVTTIGQNAFKGCQLVEKVQVTSNNVTIGANAFDSMKKLSTVELASVNTIGNNAFNGCVNLTDYHVDDVESYGTGIFSGCTALVNVDLGPISEIPQNIFKDANFIKKVTAENVTTIGASAFENCINLVEFSITDNSTNKLTTIGNNAFKNCLALETFGVDMTDVTNIGGYAFNNCVSLLGGDTDTFVIGKAGSTLTMGTYVFSGAFASAIDESKYVTEDEDGNIIQLEVPKLITKIVINSTISGDKVPDYTFHFASGIKEIDFASGITSIGEYSFSRCANLTKIRVGGEDNFYSSLTAIGKYAFTHCKVLEYPETITINIGALTEGIFNNNNKLQNVVFTRAYTGAIPANIFNYDFNLKSVTFAEGTKPTSIGAQLFNNCYNITNIYNLDLTGLASANALGSSAFANCKKLDWGENLVIGKNAGFTMAIGSSQFINNYKLKNVEIVSTTMTSMPTNAFNGCYNLKTVKVPNTLKVFYATAFASCFSLKNLYYSDGSVYDYSIITTLGNSVFDGCNNMEYDNGKLVLGGSLANIASVTSIFANNLKLKEVEFRPNTAITKIGDSTFSYCINLEKVTFNQKITQIGATVFQYCENLKELKITDGTDVTDYDLSGITTLGNNAFLNCISLESDLNLKKVTSLGTGVFSNCRLITTVDFSENTSLTSVPASTFAYCDKLNNVTLSSKIVKIDTSAFAYCFALEQIDLTTITTINASAFTNCQLLNNVTLSATITALGDNAFANCVSLTSFNVPENSTLKTIGTSTFINCISLREISLPASLTTIKATAFQRCTVLKYVYLKNTAVSIAANSFNNSSAFYLVYGTAEEVATAKTKISTYASKIITLSQADTSAREYGFDIIGGNLINYSGEYKDIVIESDKIKVRNNDSEEYIVITLGHKLNNIYSYAFVNLDDMKISISSNVQKTTKWAYRVNIIG